MVAAPAGLASRASSRAGAATPARAAPLRSFAAPARPLAVQQQQRAALLAAQAGPPRGGFQAAADDDEQQYDGEADSFQERVVQVNWPATALVGGGRRARPSVSAPCSPRCCCPVCLPRCLRLCGPCTA